MSIDDGHATSPSANPDGAGSAGTARHHLLSVLVENRPGVLTRVAGLFARRGYNIHSLAVAPTEDPAVSRISMVVDVASTPLPQMMMQLDKLINVLEISELSPAMAVEREVLLATVGAGRDAASGELNEALAGFDATVLESDDQAATVSVLGTPEQIDDAEVLLAAFGLLAVQRSGRVALPTLSAQD
jgi:acetolactate synthase I/III small subunit